MARRISRVREGEPWGVNSVSRANQAACASGMPDPVADGAGGRFELLGQRLGVPPSAGEFH
jgi:hypothetical protein